jgi:hypothetical protein
LRQTPTDMMQSFQKAQGNCHCCCVPIAEVVQPLFNAFSLGFVIGLSIFTKIDQQCAT